MKCGGRPFVSGIDTSGKSLPICHHRKIQTPAPDAGSGLFREVPRSSVLSAAVFSQSLGRTICGGLAMRIFLVGALIAGSLISFEARAQERAADAALGAVSGAVVLGPVGAVAGAIVGFTAGPSIARSWGMRGSSSSASSAPRAQRTSQSRTSSEPQSTGPAAPPLPSPRPALPSVSPPPASPPGQPQASIAPQASNKMPPVQSLE